MANWNGVIESEVRVVEPNSKLSYSWVSMGLESTVVWTLVATGGGTLLRMEHSGFRSDQDAAYKGANYGWQKFIGNLGSRCFGTSIRSSREGGFMTQGTVRMILRWIHIIVAIPIYGYIYSPFEKLPQYAPPTRYVFFPLMLLSGLMMWKGHLLRRVFVKRPA